MDRPRRRGFTLAEVLIVVLILAVLAALAVPRFADASSEARHAALMAQVRTVRTQIQLYKSDHRERLPDARIVAQLTRYTNVEGLPHGQPGPQFPFGPYLSSWPVNPVSGDGRVRVALSDEPFEAPQRDAGWYYNPLTGEFRADLSDNHTLEDGTPLNDLSAGPRRGGGTGWPQRPARSGRLSPSPRGASASR